MFHVSRRDLGLHVTLHPLIPRGAAKDECKLTPRVCFAPSVEQCVIGIVGFALRRDITFLGAFMELASEEQCPTVYYTDETLFEPEWVSDYHITHEEWALTPITVERIGYIDCMAMVRDKRIDVIETPNYVECSKDELRRYMTEADAQFLLELI